MNTHITRPNGQQELAANIVRRCREKNARFGPQIRRLARHQDLIAQKSRRDGKWYFSDDRNILQSPEAGCDDQEALEWLMS